MELSAVPEKRTILGSAFRRQRTAICRRSRSRVDGWWPGDVEYTWRLRFLTDANSDVYIVEQRDRPLLLPGPLLRGGSWGGSAVGIRLGMKDVTSIFIVWAGTESFRTDPRGTDSWSGDGDFIIGAIFCRHRCPCGTVTCYALGSCMCTPAITPQRSWDIIVFELAARLYSFQCCLEGCADWCKHFDSVVADVEIEMCMEALLSKRGFGKVDCKCWTFGSPPPATW